MTVTALTPGDLTTITTQLAALTARVAKLETPPAPSPSPTPGVTPANGLTGFTIKQSWTFGPTGTVPTIAALRQDFDSGLPWGRINGEMQVYTDFSPATHQIVGDTLCLNAVPTRGIGDQQIDSGEIVSKTVRLDFSKPGILEFNVKMASGLGMWPAGWVYGLPPSGSDEIDVFEVVYNDPSGQRDTTHGVFVNDHAGSGSTTDSNSLLDQWGKYVAPFDLAAGFHTLSIAWNGNQLNRYLDGTLLVSRAWSPKLWPSNAPPAIILNLACGSVSIDFPGKPVAASFENGANVLSCRFIRIWQ